jgi:hypothetical protein
MSLLSTILEKLGIGKQAASPAEAAPAAPSAGASPAAPQTTATTPTAAISEVDVASKLEALASQHREQLNWRTSIVDLLKLLNIDSSLTARKELAAELHYTGSTDDSAAMNIWLHSAVMKKLADNGGKVPADLLN